MTLCDFQIIDRTETAVALLCKNCKQSISIPSSVDPASIKRQCSVEAKGLIRYAEWAGEQKGWSFVWLKPELELDPARFELCPPDVSQVGTRLAQLIAIAGYETDFDKCNCKKLIMQFDLANLALLKKHINRATSLILYSASKVGMDPGRLKVKAAIWATIKAEQVRLYCS